MFILISGIAIKTLAFVPLRVPLLFDATARYALSCGINSVREKKKKKKDTRESVDFFSNDTSNRYFIVIYKGVRRR